MLFVMFSRGCRVFRPFNHEGREVDAITRWRLRSCRWRIELAVFPSGTTRTNATTMCAADLGDGHVKSKSCEYRSRAMDPIKFRTRQLPGFFVAAVATAAALRHLLHVPREQIRNTVLRTVAIANFLAVVFFRWKRRP
jgi:hypothetical protein